MQVIPVTDVSRGFGSTSRRDAWWVAPLAVFLGLSTFVVYSTWAAFQNAHYTFGPYLSPFYAPVLWASAGDAGGPSTPGSVSSPHGFRHSFRFRRRS